MSFKPKPGVLEACSRYVKEGSNVLEIPLKVRRRQGEKEGDYYTCVKSQKLGGRELLMVRVYSGGGKAVLQ